MVENLIAEALGILVIVLFIDVLYEFRTKEREFAYSRGTLKRIHAISRDAQTTAFAPFGGMQFLELPKVRCSKDVVLLRNLIRSLGEYNRKIERTIDIYGVLMTQPLASKISDVVRELDEVLDELHMLLLWQVDSADHESILEHKDELSDWIGRPSGLDRSFAMLEDLEESGAKPDELKISDYYTKLKKKYEKLDELIESFSKKAPTFWGTFKDDSVVSGAFVWAVRLKDAAMKRAERLKDGTQRRIEQLTRRTRGQISRTVSEIRSSLKGKLRGGSSAERLVSREDAPEAGPTTVRKAPTGTSDSETDTRKKDDT